MLLPAPPPRQIPQRLIHCLSHRSTCRFNRCLVRGLAGLLSALGVLVLALLPLPATARESGVRLEPRPPAWTWPLAPRPSIVRGFEPPPQRWAAGHRGVDLAGRPGSRVLAAGAGIVGFAGSVAGRPVVTVVHGQLRTTYEPVAATVRVGDVVRAGDLLGRLVPAGSHCRPRACLHWGLRRGRDYLNPLALVRAGPPRLLPVWGVPVGGRRVLDAGVPRTTTPPSTSLAAAPVPGAREAGAAPWALTGVGPSSGPAGTDRSDRPDRSGEAGGGGAGGMAYRAGVGEAGPVGGGGGGGMAGPADGAGGGGMAGEAGPADGAGGGGMAGEAGPVDGAGAGGAGLAGAAAAGLAAAVTGTVAWSVRRTSGRR